jgi:urea transporter
VNRLRGVARAVEPFLTGYAAVLFCGHPLAGLAVLAITFIRPEVGLAGLIAALAAIGVSRTSRFATREEQSALCNALLVGLALGFAFKPSLTMVAIALAAGALTALASRLLAGWLHRLNHLPALSLAFVLVAWLFLAVCRDIPALQAAGPSLHWYLPPAWLNAFLVSLGWFLFTPEPLAGAVMFLVFLFTSRYLAMLCIAGYLAGTATLALLGSTILPETTPFPIEPAFYGRCSPPLRRPCSALVTRRSSAVLAFRR